MSTTEQDNMRQMILSEVILEEAGVFNVNLTDYSCDIVDFNGVANSRDVVKVRVAGRSNTYRKETDDWTVSNREGTIRNVMVTRSTVSTNLTVDDMASGLKFRNMVAPLVRDFLEGINRDIIAAMLQGVREGKVKFRNIGSEDSLTFTSLKAIAKDIIKPNRLPSLSLTPTGCINLMPENTQQFGLQNTNLFSKIVPVTIEDEHLLGFAGYKNSLCVACCMPAEVQNEFKTIRMIQIPLPEIGINVLYTEYEDPIKRKRFAALDAMVGFEIGNPGELLVLGSDNTYAPALDEEMKLSASDISVAAAGTTATITVKTLSPIKIEKKSTWITTSATAAKDASTGVYTTTISAVIAAFTDKTGHPRFGSIHISDGKTFKGIAVRQAAPGDSESFVEPPATPD